MNEITKSFKGKRGKAALKLVEIEERCTKAFHNRYRPNLTRKNVTHFYHTEGTEPDPSKPLVSGKEALADTAARYYEALMCEKKMDVEAADGARLWELPPQALVQLAHGRLAHAVVAQARRRQLGHAGSQGLSLCWVLGMEGFLA